ncbi:MAG: hypothetical protein ACXVBQ_10130 [Pseudobdellovibrionaceae bacterium]
MTFSFDTHQLSQNKTVVIVALSLLLLVSACKETLQPLDIASSGIYNYADVDARFCTSAPAPAQQKLKYMFIIDHSASNKPGVTQDASDVQNTDADGSRRYGPMINFINNLVVDAQTTPYFGLISFNDTAAQAAGLNGFTSDLAAFVQTAKTDWVGGGTAMLPSPQDSGFTNYQAALNLAFQLIKQDAQMEAAVQTGAIITSVYQIVFVSDGVPTILNSGSTLYTQQFTTDLQPVIQNLLALKTNVTLAPYIANVSLNTAYYFNTADGANAAAITLLQKMADTGNGLFEQFGTGQQILYQAFAPASRSVVNNLVDVFVENENAVWWDNGAFMLDSDGDGLPDAIEMQFGSDRFVADTDGNGVSDLVEYRTKGKPCNGEACAAAARDPYAMCAGYSPTTDTNGRVTFASSSNDGLNDCEKFLLNGNTQSFNSNGNIIPDLLAFKNTLSIQKADASVALADPFGDGIINYQKLKLGYPIQVSTKAVDYFEPRITNLTIDSKTADGVTCYHYTVGGVAISNNENKIKVYVVQNSSLIQDKPFLMSAEASLDGNLKANFSPGDFKK